MSHTVSLTRGGVFPKPRSLQVPPRLLDLCFGSEARSAFEEEGHTLEDVMRALRRLTDNV